MHSFFVQEDCAVHSSFVQEDCAVHSFFVQEDCAVHSSLVQCTVRLRSAQFPWCKRIVQLSGKFSKGGIFAVQIF